MIIIKAYHMHVRVLVKGERQSGRERRRERETEGERRQRGGIKQKKAR